MKFHAVPRLARYNFKPRYRKKVRKRPAPVDDKSAYSKEKPKEDFCTWIKKFKNK